MKITLKVKKEHKGHVSKYTWGFPGGPEVKTPPCKVSTRDTASTPGRKIPHALQQTQARAPQLLSSLRLKPASRNPELCTLQLLKPCAFGACIPRQQAATAMRGPQSTTREVLARRN